jgi:pectinesterase
MKIAPIICLLSIAWMSCGAAHTKTVVVASDGGGGFATVQQAIAVVPEHATDRWIIEIKPGTYQGPIIVPKEKRNITFHGEDAKTTILTWSRNVRDPIPDGSDKFNPGVQIKADDFVAENLTIQNTSGNHGQALALRVDGDRECFNNCRIIGWQDTLMVNNGRDYFKNCYIAGRVDFIYGSATAVFDHCEIHSRNGGHITAASTPQEQPYGFVFLNCKLTGDARPWNPATTNPSTTEPPDKIDKMADLGRPWRPYASDTYINCYMDDHIKPEGWNNWRNPANEKTARYSEYHSTGPGAHPESRFKWTRQLTQDEADKITAKNVLAGKDGWNPNAL